MPNRTQIVAEHAYFKIGTPVLVAGMLGIIIFFLQNVHADIKEGQGILRTTIVDIAVVQEQIKNNRSDIDTSRIWLLTLSKRIREYHE